MQGILNETTAGNKSIRIRPYPDPDSRSQTNEDPCGSGSGSDFQVEFLNGRYSLSRSHKNT